MFGQNISLKKLRIASYFLFICLIPDLKDSFLETAMYTVSAVVTGFLLGCLYDYFQKQPAAKQTILVYSTRLVLLTNYLPILMDLMIVWTTIPFREQYEDLLTENFSLFCQLFSMTVWFSPAIQALVLQLALKLILVLAPALFLKLNGYWVKVTCTLFLLYPIAHQVIWAFVKGGACGKFAIFQIQHQFDVTLPSMDLIEEMRTFPVLQILLVFVFVCELGSRLAIWLHQRRKRASKSRQQPSQQDVEIVGELSQRRSRPLENSGEGPSESKVKPSASSRDETTRKRPDSSESQSTEPSKSKFRMMTALSEGSTESKTSGSASKELKLKLSPYPVEEPPMSRSKPSTSSKAETSSKTSEKPSASKVEEQSKSLLKPAGSSVKKLLKGKLNQSTSAELSQSKGKHSELLVEKDFDLREQKVHHENEKNYETSTSADMPAVENILSIQENLPKTIPIHALTTVLPLPTEQVNMAAVEKISSTEESSPKPIPIPALTTVQPVLTEQIRRQEHIELENLEKGQPSQQRINQETQPTERDKRSSTPKSYGIMLIMVVSYILTGIAIFIAGRIEHPTAVKIFKFLSTLGLRFSTYVIALIWVETHEPAQQVVIKRFKGFNAKLPLASE